MFFVAFGFLAAFSVLEMTLSVVREQIIERQQETRDLAVQALSAPPVAAPLPADGAATTAAEEPAPAQNDPRNDGLALSTIAQLILAAIIPWLLAAAALPLETIIRNSVFMVSIVGSYSLLVLAFIFRTIGAPHQTIARLFGRSGDRDTKPAKERKQKKAEASRAEDDDFLAPMAEQHPRERERKRA
jgi:hypothetical protein